MKILLSPAKMLNESSKFPDMEYSIPTFIKQAEVLAKGMKKWQITDFEKKMHLSNSLAELNYYRFQNWVSPAKKSEQRRPAIFTFNGEVYKGFDILSLPQKDYQAMNEQIAILSGLYGFLKPLDWISPYRLEMGTKAQFSKNSNLYDFWGNSIIDLLNKTENEVIINLASSEYNKVAKLKQAKVRVITPIFKDLKNGEYKTVMMYAKHQRGKMARFIIQNKTSNVEDYQSYSENNYLFNKSMSNESEWVFTR